MNSWRSNFDEYMALNGPPAVFTLDHKERLGLDEARTREVWTRVGSGGTYAACHCLFEDKKTGWHQYVLVTSEVLCVDHPRAVIHRFEDAQGAMDALAAMGPVPIRKA